MAKLASSIGSNLIGCRWTSWYTVAKMVLERSSSTDCTVEIRDGSAAVTVDIASCAGVIVVCIKVVCWTGQLAVSVDCS